MSTQIFVNLPVSNLDRSVAFFTRLGFTFNPQFTDETATCMIVSENIFVMLLTREKFAGFTPKEICDATKATEVLICLSRESRKSVDGLHGCGRDCRWRDKPNAFQGLWFHVSAWFRGP